MRPRHQRRYGQALLEFALAAPILLFLVMGILDFGRVIFAYAMASNSIRSALRNAEVLGYSPSPTYLDTDTMNQTVRKVLFVNEQTVTIRYIKSDGTYTEITKCEWDAANTQLTACSINDSNLANGDLLSIQSDVRINFITPLVNRLVPNVTLNFEGQRTIVKDIGLNGDETTDTDYDGLDDNWEKLHFGDLTSTGTDDPDNDGCNNGCEESRGTLPKNDDSDSEGLKDGEEIYTYGTNPLKWDTDDDGLNDKDELFKWFTNPLDPDTDGDKLKDGDDLPEDVPTDDLNPWHTYPTNPDSDGDGTLDGDEIEEGTDPNDPDTDGDGLTDTQELVTYHTNPLDPDSDDDKLSDGREVHPSLLTNPWDPDSDDDGLLDGDDLPEANPADDDNDWNTSPHRADSDGDSLKESEGYGPMLDGQEFALTGCTRPDLPDTDFDLLTDAQEFYIYHTDPCNRDTDGDGASDGEEVKVYRTDPLVPNSEDDFKNADVTDSDGDGLLDSWENQYFGHLNYSGKDDPDDDKCDNACEQMHDTDPTRADTDGDGLTDGDEIFYKATYPLNPDSDDDGLRDGDEVNTYGTKPTVKDTDGDGLTDYEEVMTTKTDPLKVDTDGDGLTDYEEVITTKTDPLKVDTDGDGLRDSDEIKLYTTNPLDADTDDDTLRDGDEINVYKTSPIMKDTDGDGLSDGDEVNTHKTDPNNADTDQDGLNDYAEVMQHKTNALQADTDGDGLTDGDEINRYLTNALQADTDGDSLSDGDEIYAYKTNPLAVDSDGERLKDGEEVNQYGCNPLLTDTDSDGLNDYDEVYVHHTDCAKADTDGDGVNDGDELNNGTLPTNMIGISINDVTVTEPQNSTKLVVAIFTVRLDNPSVEVTTVNYSTADFTAVSGSSGDYLSNRGTLVFNPGVTEQTIKVTIVHDKKKEPEERFYLYLMDPVNAYLLRPDTPALGIIQDND